MNRCHDILALTGDSGASILTTKIDVYCYQTHVEYRSTEFNRVDEKYNPNHILFLQALQCIRVKIAHIQWKHASTRPDCRVIPTSKQGP